MLKFLKCPFKLGLIKCIQNPCHECKASKSKKSPFPEAELYNTGGIEMINRHKYDEILNKIRSVADAYSLTVYAAKIDELANDLSNFDIKVLVVGHFSAGKSALLNLIIDKGEVLTEDQSPQTALPAEINWNTKEELQIIYNDGTKEMTNISQPIISDKINHFKYLINSPFLQELSDFTLVDTPGFDAGIEAHNKALSSYIGYGSCFVLVVSIEKGTIDTETLSFISELHKYSERVIVVLNKTDKLIPENVKKIIGSVREALDYSGISFPIIALSKYDDDAAIKLTGAIKKFDAQNVFDNKCRQLITSSANELLIHLKDIRSKLDSVEIFDHDKEIENLREKADLLQSTLEANIAKNKNKIPMMVMDIKNNVRTALEASAGNISRMLVNGNSNGAEAVILETIRPVIIQELKESSYKCIDSFVVSINYETEISDDNSMIELTQNIVNSLKEAIKDGSFSKKGQSPNSAEISVVAGTSAAGIFAAVTSILNPVLEVVLILAPVIVNFIKPLFGKSIEQKQREEFVSCIIPQILSQLDAPIRNAIEENQESISKYMKQEVDIELHSLEEAIHHIEEIKESEQVSLEDEKTKTDADIDRIQNIINDMEV